MSIDYSLGFSLWLTGSMLVFAVASALLLWISRDEPERDSLIWTLCAAIVWTAVTAAWARAVQRRRYTGRHWRVPA